MLMLYVDDCSFFLLVFGVSCLMWFACVLRFVGFCLLYVVALCCVVVCCLWFVA